MATRKSSRRPIAKNDPPGSVQPTRSTRSRSHDINDDTAGAASTVRVVPATKRRPGRPPKQTLKSRQDLPTVDETGAEIETVHRVKKGRKSSGVASALSGTTYRTSLTDEDLAMMNSDDMQEHLVDLSNAADSLSAILAPAGGISSESIMQLAQGLTNPELRSTRSFNRFQKELAESRSLYTNGNVIDVSVALRGMLGVRHVDELSTGLWRPDDILYKANIASTLEDMYLNLQEEPIDIPFERLDREFPERFLSQLVAGDPDSLTPGTSARVKETFEIGLDIRTQLTLKVLQEQTDADPEAVLSQIFCVSEDSLAPRGWDVDGLRGEALQTTQKKQFTDRTSDIRSRFYSAEDGNVDLDGLHEQFPLMAFVERFTLWARSRLTELNDRVGKAGTAVGIQHSIETEIRRRDAIAQGAGWAEDARPQSISPAPKEAQPSKRFNNSAIIENLKRLKRARPEEPTVATEPQPSATYESRNPQNHAPTAPMFGQDISSFMQDDIIPIDPALSGDTRPLDAAQLQTTAAQAAKAAQAAQQAVSAAQQHPTATPDDLHAILNKSRQHAAEANKENDPQASATSRLQQYGGPSLLDRQQGATRVDWNSQMPTQVGEVGPSPYAPMNQAGSDDDDGAFEQDQREPAPTSAQPGPRKRGRPSGSGNPPKRARFGDSIGAAIQSLTSTFEDTSAFEDYPADIQPYYRANLKAKEETAARKQNKPAQKRTAWTVEETSLLQHLIETLGTSWATIKKHDDNDRKVFQTNKRDQVALKDKARNMKFDMLKAGSTMPVNFEAVPLKTSQKKELLNHGVDIDAMEANINQMPDGQI